MSRRMTMLTNVGLIVPNVRGVAYITVQATTFTHYQNGGHVHLGRMCSFAHRPEPVFFSVRTMTTAKLLPLPVVASRLGY